MAAGKLKRRLNTPSIVSCNLQEQYRAKKKKNLESRQHLLNMRPHISLEWDDKQDRAVAKREQSGITWRDMAPFLESVPDCRMGLADVFAIPQEVFELQNVTGVLSYEVWETHLSETERSNLIQFLPRGMDPENVVQALLMGENLHFGNPFLKWGASLCSGNFHPDALLHQEQCFKANKKAYYLELQKYHNDIVESLLKWKERWSSSKDLEKEIVHKTWRKGFIKGRPGNLLIVSERPKEVGSSKKKEKPHKSCIQSGDGAKYMSYFKLSKKQHQLVKKIKQSSDGIQSKSFNHVLGDIRNFNVQPYEIFEEEERKKLHDHWLVLANRDLPKTYLGWRERQLQKQHWRSSLEQEMAEKKKHSMEEDEEKENHDSLDMGNGETGHEPTMDIQICEDEESVPLSTHSQPMERFPSLNGHHEFGCSQDIVKPDGAIPVVSEFLGNTDPTEGAVDGEAPIPSAKDVWPVASTSDSYCHLTSVSHRYTSTSELSLGQLKRIEERPTGLIDLESNIVEQDVETLLHRPSNDVGSALHINNGRSFFSSYTNQDSNELLQPSFKGQGLPTHEHKQPTLQFLATNGGVLEPCQLSGHLGEQQHQRQMGEKDLYMHQIIQKNMYSNGNRYPVASQELLSLVHVQDQAVNPIHVSAPLQSSLAGKRLLGQSCFPIEHQVHGWSGVDVSSPLGQCQVNGSIADESIFSVLSQCNKSHYHSHYDLMSVMEQYTPARNIMGAGIPGNDDVFPQTAHQHNYFIEHEATATAAQKANNMSWMNMPHQSSGLHDSIGNPILRSRNQ